MNASLCMCLGIWGKEKRVVSSCDTFESMSAMPLFQCKDRQGRRDSSSSAGPALTQACVASPADTSRHQQKEEFRQKGMVRMLVISPHSAPEDDVFLSKNVYYFKEEVEGN